MGISIDSHLKWKQHYSTTLKKANGVLAFLRRNIGDCPPRIKDNCYRVLVRPILEYGSCVWDPYHNKDIDNFEKVQKRAARFVTGNYRMETGNTRVNINKLGWKPLQKMRAGIYFFFKPRMGLITFGLFIIFII